jgi:hypothetical protein
MATDAARPGKASVSVIMAKFDDSSNKKHYPDVHVELGVFTSDRFRRRYPDKR